MGKLFFDSDTGFINEGVYFLFLLQISTIFWDEQWFEDPSDLRGPPAYTCPWTSYSARSLLGTWLFYPPLSPKWRPMRCHTCVSSARCATQRFWYFGLHDRVSSWHPILCQLCGHLLLPDVEDAGQAAWSSPCCSSWWLPTPSASLILVFLASVHTANSDSSWSLKSWGWARTYANASWPLVHAIWVLPQGFLHWLPPSWAGVCCYTIVFINMRTKAPGLCC